MAIKFFNIRSGEIKTVDTEPLIAAFFNSTDQHVNARLGQDFGWRLAPETIARIREIQSNQNTLDRIAQTFNLPIGEVADTDVVRWISLEDARTEARKNQEEQSDHEAEYQRQLRELDEKKTVSNKIDSKKHNDSAKIETSNNDKQEK